MDGRMAPSPAGSACPHALSRRNLQAYPRGPAASAASSDRLRLEQGTVRARARSRATLQCIRTQPQFPEGCPLPLQDRRDGHAPQRSVQALSDLEGAAVSRALAAIARARRNRGHLRMPAAARKWLSAAWERRRSWDRSCAPAHSASCWLPAHLFPTLWGHGFRPGPGLDRPGAGNRGTMIGLAARTSDPSLVLQAEHATWTTPTPRLPNCSRPVAMLRQAFRSTAWTSTPGSHQAIVITTPASAVACSVGMSWLRLGRADEAREIGEEAIRLAEELQHPSRAHWRCTSSRPSPGIERTGGGRAPRRRSDRAQPG